MNFTNDYGGYEGFETSSTNLKLILKMHMRLIFFIALLHIIITSLVIIGFFGGHKIETYATYNLARIISKFSPGTMLNYKNPDGSVQRFESYTLAHQPDLKIFSRNISTQIRNIIIVCCLIYLLYPLSIRYFSRKAKDQLTKKNYLRGSRLISIEEYKREVKKKKDKLSLPFGKTKMPIKNENRHLFVSGSQGGGKTQLFLPIVKELRKRGERAVLYDFKPDYLPNLYDETQDIIFNPLDSRSINWNIFSEIETYMDIDSIATSLIPPNISNVDPFWNDAARDVFAGILHYLYQNNLRTNKDLWRMVTSEIQYIADCLKVTKGGERGYSAIQDASSRQALGVIAVMMRYCKCFEYMVNTNSDSGFSVKEWVEKGDGMIFITNYADVQDTLRPILSLFIDLFGKKLISLRNPSYKLRINSKFLNILPEKIYNSISSLIEPFMRPSIKKTFFILDEFGTLQRLSSIVKILTLSRSFGGCCYLGIQDYGQIDHIYSENHRHSILNSTKNKAFFAMADDVTAKITSDLISETEYMHAKKTVSMGVSDSRDGISISYEKIKEPLFLPSEILNLPDLTAIVKFNNYDFIKVKWKHKKFKKFTEGFCLRDDLMLDQIEKEQILNQRDIARYCENHSTKKKSQPKRSKPKKNITSTEKEKQNIETDTNKVDSAFNHTPDAKSIKNVVKKTVENSDNQKVIDAMIFMRKFSRDKSIKGPFLEAKAGKKGAGQQIAYMELPDTEPQTIENKKEELISLLGERGIQNIMSKV